MKMRTEVLREVRKMRFLEVYDRYVLGWLSLVEAAETLGLSERQFRRVRGRFASEGEAGLLDRRLGRVSPHRIAADEVDRIVALYRDRYAGWTAKHFHERASEKHGLGASYGWTKSVLTAAGLRRSALKRSAHRKKRPRRPMVGMMLHQDGSRHEWIPGLGRGLDLIVHPEERRRRRARHRPFGPCAKLWSNMVFSVRCTRIAGAITSSRRRLARRSRRRR